MPNFLAHSLVAKRVRAKEIQDEASFLLPETEDFFILGSFGPDALFFGGLLPQNGLHLGYARKKLGNRIHKTDGKKYFKYLVDEVYSIDDVKHRKQREAFILGQLCHYFLDSTAHPFVRYQSGFGEDGRISGKYHFEHGYFETRIDSALGAKYGISYYLEPDHFPIPDRKDALARLDQYYGEVLKEMFGLKKFPKHYYTGCIKNWISLYKLANKKGKFFSFLYGKSQIGALRAPEKADLSILNEEKKDWRDPVTGELHNDSFIQRHAKATELTHQCYKELKKGFNYDTIAKYLTGLDYYGRQPGAVWKYWKGKKAAK